MHEFFGDCFDDRAHPVARPAVAAEEDGGLATFRSLFQVIEIVAVGLVPLLI
jgi:hypothetical protein